MADATANPAKDQPSPTATSHEESAHGAHPPGIDVAFQAVNVGLFVLLMVFLTRKKVRALFSGRQVSYRQALAKADAAKGEAERKKRETQELLSGLEASARQNADAARSDAEQMRARMLAEAQALNSGLRQDAERTVELELARAKAELRSEMIAQAMALAKATLSEKMLEPDQKRLQTEFVEKIQVVRP